MIAAALLLAACTVHRKHEPSSREACAQARKYGWCGPAYAGCGRRLPGCCAGKPCDRTRVPAAIGKVGP